MQDGLSSSEDHGTYVLNPQSSFDAVGPPTWTNDGKRRQPSLTLLIADNNTMDS